MRTQGDSFQILFIDTHCHLNFKAFNRNYREVYKRAQDAGVNKIVIVGTSLASSRRAVEMAAELPGCFASVGVHPHHIKEFQELGANEIKNQLSALVDRHVVAVGETGLDNYTYKNYPQVSQQVKTAQKELLKIHFGLADKFNLPLILHCREAMDDMIPYLIQSFKRLNSTFQGVFHCFSGDDDKLRKVLDMGFYVGFDGNISYPENELLRQMVKATPINRLLLETDAPYLTPEPYRGQPSEPAYIPLIAKEVASIKNTDLKNIEQQTTANALALFSLSP